MKTGAAKKRTHSEPEDGGQDSSPPSTPRPNPAKERKKAKLKTEDLLALVNSRFLQEKEMDLWCTITAIRTDGEEPGRDPHVRPVHGAWTGAAHQ
jgi:hypothetical protein